MGSDHDRRSQWLRGVLELCTLALLRESAGYGYEIRQLLAHAGLGDIKGGTLYPVLGRLEDAGLVHTDWRPGPSGPNRKYYALTPAGHAVLGDLTTQWTQFSDAVTKTLEGVAVRDP